MNCHRMGVPGAPGDDPLLRRVVVCFPTDAPSTSSASDALDRRCSRSARPAPSVGCHGSRRDATATPTGSKFRSPLRSPGAATPCRRWSKAVLQNRNARFDSWVPRLGNRPEMLDWTCKHWYFWILVARALDPHESPQIPPQGASSLPTALPWERPAGLVGGSGPWRQPRL